MTVQFTIEGQLRMAKDRIIWCARELIYLPDVACEPAQVKEKMVALDAAIRSYDELNIRYT